MAAGEGESGWDYPSDEPNLALGWESEGPLIKLKFLLSHEFLPPEPEGNRKEYELHMLVRPGALLRFADQLVEDVAAFPIRTWGDDACTARIAKRYRQTVQRL